MSYAHFPAAREAGKVSDWHFAAGGNGFIQQGGSVNQGDACWVGSHEYLPYFPDVWSSKHLILAIGSNVQKSHKSHLSVSACSLSGLEAVAGMGRSWL